MMRSYSSRAHCGLSRSAWMRRVTSAQGRCRWSRLLWNTLRLLRVMRISSRALSWPTTWLHSPRPARRSTCITRARSAARICGIALEGIDVVGRGIESDRVEIQRHAAVPCERHLADGGEEAAVGTVVVGEK